MRCAGEKPKVKWITNEGIFVYLKFSSSENRRQTTENSFIYPNIFNVYMKTRCTLIKQKEKVEELLSTATVDRDADNDLITVSDIFKASNVALCCRITTGFKCLSRAVSLLLSLPQRFCKRKNNFWWNYAWKRAWKLMRIPRVAVVTRSQEKDAKW